MAANESLENLASTGLLKHDLQDGRRSQVDVKLLDGLIDAALELLDRVRSLAASHGFD